MSGRTFKSLEIAARNCYNKVYIAEQDEQWLNSVPVSCYKAEHGLKSAILCLHYYLLSMSVLSRVNLKSAYGEYSCKEQGMVLMMMSQ